MPFLDITLNLSKATELFRRVTGGGGREVYPALFQKLEKSALTLGKKCPDCGHLWV